MLNNSLIETNNHNRKRLQIKAVFWAIYFAFVIAMPYDVFKSTAILVLEQPANIVYYRVSVFYLSVLFLPIVFKGILSITRKNQYIVIHPLALIALLGLKDVFVWAFSIMENPELYWFSTYGNYIIASLYFITVSSVYRDRIDSFLKLYAIVNIASLIFSFITGIGLSTFLSGRLHMSALQQGETAVVLSILSLYFAFQNKDNINWIILLIGVFLVLTTGNRKDIVYILVCVIVYFLRKRNVWKRITLNKRRFVVSILFIGAIVFVAVRYGKDIISRLDLTRYSELFSGISQNGLLSYITEDSSYVGRMASFEAGFKVIKQSPILGGFFSLVGCQKNMQLFNYPTFPHSTVMYLYCVMGVFSLIPIVHYIRNAVGLFKINHPLQYVYLYILIRDTISGGANEAIKYLLLMMIVLNLGTYVIKNNHDELEYSECFLNIATSDIIALKFQSG